VCVYVEGEGVCVSLIVCVEGEGVCVSVYTRECVCYLCVCV
jgi:hypothetical protein